MDIIKINYKSTNYYFINSNNGLLGFDAGWPGTYGTYRDSLKQKGYRINDIKWIIVSHFHIDHAGLAGILSENGVKLILFENQLNSIKIMEKLMERKKMKYHKINLKKIKLMEIEKSREWLKSIGIKGEIIITDCHSEDSISLILDNGIAFTGDLPPKSFIMDTDIKCKKNWEILKSKGVKYIKPTHGNSYRLFENF